LRFWKLGCPNPSRYLSRRAPSPSPILRTHFAQWTERKGYAPDRVTTSLLMETVLDGGYLFARRVEDDSVRDALEAQMCRKLPPGTSKTFDAAACALCYSAQPAPPPTANYNKLVGKLKGALTRLNTTCTAVKG
jgi:hypothetical protein